MNEKVEALRISKTNSTDLLCRVLLKENLKKINFVFIRVTIITKKYDFDGLSVDLRRCLAKVSDHYHLKAGFFYLV